MKSSSNELQCMLLLSSARWITGEERCRYVSPFWGISERHFSWLCSDFNWRCLADSWLNLFVFCLLGALCIKRNFFNIGHIETDFLELFWLSGLILLMFCKIKTLHLCFYCLSWFPLKRFIQLSVSAFRRSLWRTGSSEPRNYVFHAVGVIWITPGV